MSKIDQFLTKGHLLSNVFCWCLIAYMALILISKVALSFSWPMGDDAAYLIYISWLFNEHGQVPYVDRFEYSFPGTIFFHVVLGKIFGYSNLGFHLANVVILLLLMISTVQLLKPYGWRVAVSAALLFAVSYMQLERSMHFQRDYLAILPIVVSLLVIRDITNKTYAYFFMGFFLSVALSFKPHLILLAPIAVGAAILLREVNYSVKNIMIGGGLCFIGAMSWALFLVAWLLYLGALPSFLEIATNYLPLYMENSGTHSKSTWLDNMRETMSRIMLYIPFLWALSAIGCAWAWLHNKKYTDRVFIGFLFLAVIFCSIYIIISAKGWTYHWIPAVYFFIACFGLILCNGKPNGSGSNAKTPLINIKLRITGVFTPIIFFYILLWLNIVMRPSYIVNDIKSVIAEHKNYPIKSESLKDLNRFLAGNTSEGDKILLRVGGTVGPFFPALIENKLLPQTRFHIQSMVYHHAESPYIQKNRRQLISQLHPLPQWILTEARMPLPAYHPEYSFYELENILLKHYTLAYDNTNKASFAEQFFLYKLN